MIYLIITGIGTLIAYASGFTHLLPYGLDKYVGLIAVLLSLITSTLLYLQSLPHTFQFKQSDWIFENENDYSITIPRKIHKKNNVTDVVYHSKDSEGNYRILISDYRLKHDKSVILKSGMAFDGRAIIK